MLKNVLVTGGSGFIGSHVIENLISKGYGVTVFDRKHACPLGDNAKINHFFGDVTDSKSVSEAIFNTDAVIHLAGILGTSETVDNPLPCVTTNIFGGLNVLEACRKQNKPGVTISLGNYWMNNPYSISKSIMERFVHMYNKEHHTKIAIVRGLNAYGERQKHYPVRKIIPNFVVRALRGAPISIYGDGEQIMDMVYVKDLAEILVRALTVEHNAYTQVFEAGTGLKTTVNYIAKKVIEYSKSSSEIKYLPMRAGEEANAIVLANPETLKPLGPLKLKDLDETLDTVIKWYRENYPWKDAEL